MRQIIIIDDDKIIGFVHKRLLEKAGYGNILVFHNAEEALCYLETSEPKEKQLLILLDINMPYMDGWEFINKARTLDFIEYCLIYMLSSSIDPDDKLRSAEIKHIEGLIEKPLSSSKIEVLINRFEKNFI